MNFLRRNALSVTLLLVTFALGLCVYTVLRLGDERNRTILRECSEQNARHNGTLKQLDAVLAKSLKQHPERREQIIQSRAPTVLLIDQLAPYQNCQQVLAKST